MARHPTHLAKYIGLGQLFQLRPGLRQITAAREILEFSENEPMELHFFVACAMSSGGGALCPDSVPSVLD